MIFVGGESGSADTVFDPRGFAVKLYTEDGNWDLVGNNTPIFFIRDPIFVRIPPLPLSLPFLHVSLQFYPSLSFSVSSCIISLCARKYHILTSTVTEHHSLLTLRKLPLYSTPLTLLLYTCYVVPQLHSYSEEEPCHSPEGEMNTDISSIITGNSSPGSRHVLGFLDFASRVHPPSFIPVF